MNDPRFLPITKRKEVYGARVPSHALIHGICPACGFPVWRGDDAIIAKWPTTDYLSEIHSQCLEA